MKTCYVVDTAPYWVIFSIELLLFDLPNCSTDCSGLQILKFIFHNHVRMYTLVRKLELETPIVTRPTSDPKVKDFGHIGKNNHWLLRFVIESAID